MYEFWYDYIKPKYQNNVKLCYTDTGSFIIKTKTEDFDKGIADDVENRFDASIMELTLPTEKNKNVIGLIKDELGGKIMTEFVALRPKTYSYLMDHGNSDSDTHAIKKVKGTKKYVIKRVLRFNDYKNRLLDNKIKLNSQQRFKSESHNVHTEEINNIALSSNDGKRLQNFDRFPSHPYVISVGKQRY